MKKNTVTVVTGFWDIDREHWNSQYKRDPQLYLNDARRVMTVEENLVVFVDAANAQFVRERRETLGLTDKTLIIPMEKTELPAYKHRSRIASIMRDPEFQEGLAAPDVPEVCEPWYLVVIWSKIALMARAAKENPFDTTHFVWMDFGMHTYMIPDQFLNKPLPFAPVIDDRITMMCRSEPQPEDLDVRSFFKSHNSRTAACFMTGGAESVKRFSDLIDEEIEACLKMGVVDCEQSIYALVYLKHPDLFRMYMHPHWSGVMTQYPWESSVVQG